MNKTDTIKQKYLEEEHEEVVRFVEGTPSIKESSYDDLKLLEAITVSLYETGRLAECLNFVNIRLNQFRSEHKSVEIDSKDLDLYYNLATLIFSKQEKLLKCLKLLKEYRRFGGEDESLLSDIGRLQNLYYTKYLSPLSNVVFPMLYVLVIVLNRYLLPGILPKEMYLPFLVIGLAWISLSIFKQELAKKILVKAFL